MKMLDVKIGGKIFRVKDCLGISAARGLMFESMDNIDGALIHGRKPLKIWMPFVPGKLRLLFLDDEMRVVKDEIAAPMTFNPKTWKTYACENASKCLELKDIKLRINKGTRIKIGSVV